MKFNTTTFRNTLVMMFLTLCFSASYAQFTINGELRPRYEYRHGFKSLFKDGKESASFISQRTRIALGYKDKLYSIGVSFQDIRVWGDNPLASLSDHNASFHEAWAELKIVNQLSVKLGRQELVLDDNRLYSNGDWSLAGRSHDMALLKWNPDPSFKVNVGLAFNQDKEQTETSAYTVTNNYKAMQLLWMHKDWNSNGLSLLLSNIGYEQLTTVAGVTTHNIRYLQTFGGRYSYKGKQLSLNAAGYLQTGKDANNRNVSANYADIDAIATINSHWSVIPRAEHFSGTATNNISALKTNYSFNPLFGSAHRVNGTMDYFYCSNHLDNVGLNDLSMGLNYTKDQCSTLLTAHAFYADAKVSNLSNEAEALNNKLGTELDLQFIYKISPTVTCTCGYSQLFATRTLEVLKAGDHRNTNNYAFIMMTFKPEFLK